jgi:hypothetical protein
MQSLFDTISGPQNPPYYPSVNAISNSYNQGPQMSYNTTGSQAVGVQPYSELGIAPQNNPGMQMSPMDPSQRVGFTPTPQGMAFDSSQGISSQFGQQQLLFKQQTNENKALTIEDNFYAKFD